jgi:hypothetical protein
MKVSTIFSLSLIAFSFIACSKKGSTSTIATASSVTTYYWGDSIGGTCYNSSNSTVDDSYCSGQTAYYISGGVCRNTSGTAVAISYCTSLTYFYSNGQCFNSSGSVVASTYCTSGTTTSTGYYINNYTCYNSSNVAVDYSYCTSGTSGSTCSGLYYYIDYYGNLYKVTCDGIANSGNCSGYELIQGSTGNYVYCN